MGVLCRNYCKNGFQTNCFNHLQKGGWRVVKKKKQTNETVFKNGFRQAQG